ncbi:MAG: hypothetical protein AB7I79_15760 [Rhizobiaceae bacterium]
MAFDGFGAVDGQAIVLGIAAGARRIITGEGAHGVHVAPPADRADLAGALAEGADKDLMLQ